MRHRIALLWAAYVLLFGTTTYLAWTIEKELDEQKRLTCGVAQVQLSLTFDALAADFSEEELNELGEIVALELEEVCG